MLCLIPAFLLLFSLDSIAQESAKAATQPDISGAYRFPGGRVVSILPSSDPGRWRYVDLNSGDGHKLYPAAQLEYRSAGDWNSETPEVFTYRFALGKDGKGESVQVQRYGGKGLIGRRIRFREEVAEFESGGTKLYGKLTLPETGRGPFKTVVFVHGSDAVPSVDREWLAHLLASNGMAAFVFDKRGTGRSGGQYTQHFGILSGDVVAAVRWLKSNNSVDAARIGLAGFSQGGWVAPLAAKKEPAVKFVLVGYGMAMSIADEDRLEAPLKLRMKEFSEQDIAEFKEFNAALHTLVKGGGKDWAEFETVAAKYKDKSWFGSLKGSGTWAGFVMEMGIPQAKTVLPQMLGTFFEPFYDPVPTLESLNIPMLWMIAADDIEAPPEITLDVLKRLRSKGKPFETRVFPRSDHGLTEFLVVDGKRVTTKYADGYFQAIVRWLRRR
jgi:hypothetical protein